MAVSLPEVAVKKSELLFGLLAYVGDVGVPFKVAGDGDAEVFDCLDTGDSERVERYRPSRFSVTPGNNHE